MISQSIPSGVDILRGISSSHHLDAPAGLSMAAKIGLSTGAPTGYPDPDPRVFGVTKPIPGPARIFSHGSPGSAGQIPVGHGYPQVYLRVTDTCRYTCADGYSNTCGLQVYLRVTNTHRYTCTDGYWRVYLQVSSSEMFIVHASDYIVYH
jgi:hypothetical protein